LHDLKIDVALGEVVGLVDGEADWNRLDIVPGYFMFFDGFALGAPAVFGGGRGGQMPFYKGGSCYEGDVVEVDDLGLSVAISDSGVAERYVLSG
jgi:hypothetical protein